MIVGDRDKTLRPSHLSIALILILFATRTGLTSTNHYAANSAWLQLSILAHNLMRSFQRHSTLALPKPRSCKRTYSYRIASMKNLRFLLINRAARLTRISGRKILRFSANSATEALYDRIAHQLRRLNYFRIEVKSSLVAKPSLNQP